MVQLPQQAKIQSGSILMPTSKAALLIQAQQQIRATALPRVLDLATRLTAGLDDKRSKPKTYSKLVRLFASAAILAAVSIWTMALIMSSTKTAFNSSTMRALPFYSKALKARLFKTALRQLSCSMVTELQSQLALSPQLRIQTPRDLTKTYNMLSSIKAHYRPMAFMTLPTRRLFPR